MSDRRRILGPSDAKIPILGASSALQTSESSFSAEKSPAASQNRSSDNVRSFFLKSGLTKNANGLAYLEVGDCILEVAVFGPRPIRGLFVEKASFSVECKFLPYITQPEESIYNGASQTPQGRPGLTPIEHKVSAFVETAFLPALLLEKYPKSTIDVFITVVAFNSQTASLLNLAAWTINCTSLALVDAGIEMRDLVSAGHVSISGEKTVLDPQLDPSAATECVASYMEMQNNELVAFWIEGGEVSLDILLRLMAGCETMSLVVRKNINGLMLLLAAKKD